MTTQPQKPTITLQSVKIHHGLSQETHAFTAKVYVDGVYFADAGNAGHGGMTDIHAPRTSKRKETLDQMGDRVGRFNAAERDLNAIIAATSPVKYVIEGTDYRCQLDDIVDQLVDDRENTRKCKATLARKLMVARADGLYTLKSKPTPEHVAGATAEFTERGDGVILNSLPIAEAEMYYYGERTFSAAAP